MRKLTLLALAAIALSGCIEDGADLTNGHKTVTVCLDGVAYWLLSAESQSQTMAPKIDPETLQFVRCEKISNKDG